MHRVRVVQEVLEGQIGWTQAVEEVLAENGAAIGVSSFLSSVLGVGGEEGIVWQTVDQRCLTDNLNDSASRTAVRSPHKHSSRVHLRVFDRRAMQRVEVSTDQSDTVGELLDVFPA